MKLSKSAEVHCE